MNTIELTLSVENVDMTRALSDWSWLLDKPLSPLFLNKFGDWFFFNTSGNVEMLDTLEGQLQQIAPNAEEFTRLSKTIDKQSEWFLDGLVYRLHNEQQLLREGQCYGFNLHPIMGGQFEVPNIGIYSIEVYNSLCGQLHRQLRDIS